MKKWLFNPFVFIAGGNALAIGLVAMGLTAIIAYFSHTHFDGVIDLHYGAVSPMRAYLLEQAAVLGTITAVFYLAGLIFSRSSIRLIDVAGTMALSRWVMIIPALIGFGVNMPTEMPQTVDEIMKLITPAVVLLSLLSVVFVIWMIALMYNAFTVSCNIKGGKATAVFIAGLLIAEIISKIVLYLLYK